METLPKVFTIDPLDPPDIVMGETGLAALKPLTVGQVFRMTRDKYPHLPALAVDKGGEWEVTSYTEYYNKCLQVAKSFLKLDLEHQSVLGILCSDCPEFSLSIIGAIFAGLIPCIVPLCDANECQYILNESKANVVIVTNNEQLERIVQIWGQLPCLKTVVLLCKPSQTQRPDLYEWNDFLKLGEDIKNDVIEKIISDQRPKDCGTICYTSGTTGIKKGVMFSHDNLTWTAQNIELREDLFAAGDCRLAYLGSSIGAQLVQLFVPICKGLTVYFVPPSATKGMALIKTLRRVQPHLFFGVPWIWEGFMKSVLEAIPEVSSLDKERKEVLREQALCHLGLNRCKKMVSGGAPFHTVMKEFYTNLGINITVSWGMTEGGAMAVYNPKDKPGSVGKPHLGLEIKIASSDPINNDGEICLRGRNVMMGYLNKLNETSEAIDSNGWYHTKDIGHFDNEGYLYITGRFKELFTTSMGVTILPGVIEDKIKVAGAPFISNAVVVGDKQPFVSCLITLKCTFDSEGTPTDELSADVQHHLSVREGSSTTTSISEIMKKKDPIVYGAIQRAIDAANDEMAPTSQHQVKRFVVLHKDFSCVGREIDGASLKFRRRFVLEKYKEQIDLMYEPNYMSD